MKKTLQIVCWLGLLFAFSCNAPNDDHTNAEVQTEDSTNHVEENGTPDMHTSQISLDWAGTYEGITPCADCPGIKMTVTLNADHTFTTKQEYLERDVPPIEENGTFEWESNGGYIVLKDGDQTKRFQVGENRLILVANNSVDLPKEVADKFVLEKKQSEK